MASSELEKLVRSEPIEELYQIGQELGRGKFAIVKRCTEKSTGNQYAAKYLRKRRGGKSCRSDILVEIDIMKQSMNHHRIIKIHEVFESQREMIIVIELATGGELFRMIAVDPFPEAEAKNIVYEILDGVQHLHSLNIVHLDIKPENILLYRKGQLDIKIADFGLAMQIFPGEQIRTLVGTAEYVAPEILNYEPISTQADMWSIGALAYALFTGYSPFQGDTHNETFYYVSFCEYDFDNEVFDDVSQDAKDFIEELLQKEPSARLTASQCLQHPWMQSLTSTTVQNPQTQVTEGLNSSTSSLDSAMWLDSLSSLEHSPISSTSSSFAPRPNGKEENDASIKQQHEDMTQVVSKLCTEMQKAGNDSAIMINSNLDGSASSISSNDSSNTLKPEDEDVGVFIPQSTTPPPASSSSYTKRSESSSSSIVEDEMRSISRPSSGLRVTTPVSADVASYAPETIEKLEKLKRLKQMKVTMEKEKEKEGQTKDKEKLNERRFSSPVTSMFSKLKLSSFKLKTHSETAEDIASEPPRSKTPTLGRKQSSPVPERNQPSPVPIRDQVNPGTIHSQLSPVPIRDQPSPIPKHDKQSPMSTSPVPTDIKNSSSTHNRKSPVPIPKVRSPVPTPKGQSPVPSNTRQSPVSQDAGTKVVQNSQSLIPEPSKSPILPTSNRSLSPKHEQNPSIKSSPVSSETPPTNFKSSSPASFRSPSPVDNRGKSYSPQTTSKTPQTSNRHTKSVSPASGSSSIVMRNKGVKQPTRQSWRQTPHIDPDAIEALLNLNGDVVDDILSSQLETCTEEPEPQPTEEKKTHLTKLEENPSILKKSGHSDSDVVVRRDAPRKTVKISSRQRGTKHQSLYFGSPDRSPPQQDALKNNKVTSLQKSLTLSYSSPDLSALLGSGKIRTKNPKREDSYVTGSATPKVSSRRSFFGGNALTRSLTISGKGSKKTPAYIREKYKLRKKEQ